MSNQYDVDRQIKEAENRAWWWLRSPGSDSDSAAHVSNVGSVYASGNNVPRDSGGVRPALWLNLKF
jgi:hypothetical protein